MTPTIKLAVAFTGTMVLAPCLAPAAQQARDLTQLSLEELVEIEIPTVVGASKHEQKANEAPSSVSVITSEDIKKYGYQTLADIMRSVRGFYVTNNRNYNFLGVRGFSRPDDYSSRILLLIDGHRFNDAIYATASIEPILSIDVDLIDRVEVIRGPGSSLYGNNAFFGVINIVSKRAKDVQSVELAASYGSFDTKRGRLTVGKQWESGLELLGSYSAAHSDGDTHLAIPDLAGNPAFNNGVMENSDWEGWKTAFGSLRYAGFTVTAASSWRRKGFGDGIYGTDFGAENHSTDGRLFLDVQYERPLSAGSNIQARVFYDRYDYHANFIIGGLLNRDTADDQWWGTEVKYATRLGQRQYLTVGAEYIDHFQVDQQNFDVEPFQSFLDSKEKLTSFGLYVQDEVRLTDKLLVNLGARYDASYKGNSSTNPRIALVYNPTDSTALKLLYGTAFRAPNASELYYAPSSLGVVAPSSLEPEKIRTAEVALEHSFTKNLRGVASVYQYRVTDLITQVPDPGGAVFRNVDRVDTKGLDLELEARWPWAEGRASYSYQDAQDQATGETLSNAPRHLGKLNVAVPFWGERLWAGFETQYVGSRTNSSGGKVDGYTVSNMTLFNRGWVKGLELTAGVYNLFDEEYGDPSSIRDAHLVSIPQDGRTFRVKVSYRF